MPTRRAVLAGTLAIAAPAGASPGLAPVSRPSPSPSPARVPVGPTDDAVLFGILDAVGRIEADVFNPARALDAMEALMTFAPAPRVEALRRYCAARPDPESGVIAVVR